MAKHISLAPLSAILKMPALQTLKSGQAKAYLALLVVYLIWGTTMGAMSLGVSSIPASMLIFSRFVLAGFICLGLCFFRGEALPPFAEIRRHCIAGMLLFVAGNAVTAWAVQYLPTVIGSVLIATTPFFMMGLAAYQPPREPLSLRALAGAALGFAGILILLQPQLALLWGDPVAITSSTAGFRFGPMAWLAALSMLFTAFFWAWGSVYAKQHPTQHSSMLMGVGIQNIWAALCLMPLAVYQLFTMDIRLLHPSLMSVGALLYLVLFGTILATPCYFYVLKHTPVSVSSTFAYVTPVLAMFFGWQVLGESLTPTMALGAGVILSGVILVQGSRK